LYHLFLWFVRYVTKLFSLCIFAATVYIYQGFISVFILLIFLKDRLYKQICWDVNIKELYCQYSHTRDGEKLLASFWFNLIPALTRSTLGAIQCLKLEHFSLRSKTNYFNNSNEIYQKLICCLKVETCHAKVIENFAIKVMAFFFMENIFVHYIIFLKILLSFFVELDLIYLIIIKCSILLSFVAEVAMFHNGQLPRFSHIFI